MEPPLEPQPSDASESNDPVDDLSAFDVDAIAALAEFEAEHRRALAMQSLYYRRRRAGGAA